MFDVISILELTVIPLLQTFAVNLLQGKVKISPTVKKVIDICQLVVENAHRIIDGIDPPKMVIPNLQPKSPPPISFGTTAVSSEQAISPLQTNVNYIPARQAASEFIQAPPPITTEGYRVGTHVTPPNLRGPFTEEERRKGVEDYIKLHFPYGVKIDSAGWLHPLLPSEPVAPVDIS